MKRALTLVALCALAVNAQQLNHKIDLPKDSPVGLLSADFNNSTATARGGMYVVDVHASLSLRNTTQRRIRGIAFAVYAPEVGGKGSISVPSLDVAPGETFSVRLENHLVRPLTAGSGGPSVEVKLDGVLFDDLGFYGPDSLDQQRQMTRWELEARRDREYFKSVLKAGGPQSLQKEMLASLRQSERRGPGVQIVRGRATNVDSERDVQFAFAAMPDAPVEPLDGTARVSPSEARAPRISIRNRSAKPVEHLEIGWIVKDQQGREFYAASMPADLKLAPNGTGEVRQDAALRFQTPVAIQSVTGFVSGVEFANGQQWIPSRASLNTLRGIVPASPEEQRLLQIYNKRGLDALIEELKKF
ncbi:MAG: hypothetical protein RL328_656 [Acidobacteriota bacterium]|jgi:hypothetical protein